MKKTLFLIAFFWCLLASAQNGTLNISKINSVAFQADAFLGYDKFGFWYYVTNNVLIKQNERVSVEYKNLSLGKISKVDLQNPLKIVVFYETFNTVILLDNQLNETQKISFSEHTIPIVAAAVGISSQNRLWIYNTLSQQIGLYDFQTNDYKPITTPFTGTVKAYVSDFNYFQWIDEQLNRRATDVYGKISDLGKTEPFDQFRIGNEYWYFYSKDNTIFAKDLKNNLIYTVAVAEKTFKSFVSKDQILTIFTTDGITNYKIILP